MILESTRLPMLLKQDSCISGQRGELALQAAVDVFLRFCAITG